MFRIIHKEELVIFSECAVAIPMSHTFPSELLAKKWMLERGMSSYCKVVSESIYKQRGGK